MSCQNVNKKFHLPFFPVFDSKIKKAALFTFPHFSFLPCLYSPTELHSATYEIIKNGFFPMFISALELFKIGIGPSSSHTMGPMVAANRFIDRSASILSTFEHAETLRVRCTLKGSLAFTGKGHGTDRAIILGLHGHTPESVANQDPDLLLTHLSKASHLPVSNVCFWPDEDIYFDRSESLPQHPNGMIFELINDAEEILFSETYFSIGGGFIATREEMERSKPDALFSDFPYAFDSAGVMLKMAETSGLSIAAMKRINEHQLLQDPVLNERLDEIWQAMKNCIKRGLSSEGILPGNLALARRAKALHQQLQDDPDKASVNDWLCAFAMAVIEENAAGHPVVTAPTNGAAGVIPAVLYNLVTREGGTPEQVRDFLLTASAIGGIIKHRSSISGAEVGCQGEIGSAASMAAAGLCAVRGGTPRQIENAAEIALEHHLGMTCDPIHGLVQVPCIERNGFGAIKAYTAASLALRGSGHHVMSLDKCIAAMKQTGLEMSEKFKETSLGGLAVSYIEC